MTVVPGPSVHGPAPAPLRTGPVVLGAVLVAAVCGLAAGAHVLAPLVLATVVAGAALAWHRPVVCGVVVLALVPAASGLERGLLVPGVKPSELLLVAAAGLLLLRRPALGQRFGVADWCLTAFAVAAAALAVGHVVTGASEPASLVRVGLQPAMLLLTWWVASRAVRDEGGLRTALRWALLAGTVPAGLTLLQALDAPGVRALLKTLVGGPLLADPGLEGVVRATGPFPIWHTLAAYLLPLVVVATVLLLRRDATVLATPLLVAVLALDVAALTLSLTITVAAWAVGAVLVAAALQRRLTAAVLLLAVVCAAATVAFSGPLSARFEAQTAARAATPSLLPQTVAYRVEVWERDFVPLLERALPVGIANDLPESVLFQNTENQYISLVLRGGAPLLLAAVVAVAAVGAAVGAARRRPDVTGAAAAAAVGVVVLLPLASTVWPYLTNAGFPQTWLALAGAVAGAARARSGAIPAQRPAVA
jgi:hypothetical protein